MGPEAKYPPLSPKVEEKGILDSEAIFRDLKHKHFKLFIYYDPRSIRVGQTLI